MTSYLVGLRLAVGFRPPPRQHLTTPWLMGCVRPILQGMDKCSLPAGLVFGTAGGYGMWRIFFHCGNKGEKYFRRKCIFHLRIASRFRPLARKEAQDRIKPVVIGNPVDVRQEGLFEKPSKDLVTSAAVVDNSCEEKFQITFTVGADFMEQLERMKELVFRGEKDELELENVFSQAMELYISKHCPKERNKRRVSKKVEQEEVQDTEVVSTNPELVPEPRSTPSRSRYIPVALRDQVLSRDGCQCTYVSPEGIHCGSPWDLEIDHITPFALGGETSLDNLRVLCSAHNLLAACEHFGPEYIEARVSG